MQRRKPWLESSLHPASWMLVLSLQAGAPEEEEAQTPHGSSSSLQQQQQQQEIPAGGQRWRRIFTASLPDTVELPWKSQGGLGPPE